MRSNQKTLQMLLLCIACFFMTGCAPKWWTESMDQNGIGGGQDTVAVQLPFDAGYTAKCVQGANGAYSHQYTSTKFDVDLDTPNDVDDYVFAPVNGVAYIHTDRSSGFGEHVNIDLSDGTYVLLAHLEQIFVEDGEEVVAGQLIGYEGTTGASTGDHVHIGRHQGDASLDAGLGESIEGFALELNHANGVKDTLSTSEMQCDISAGDTYTSVLQTPRWHPSGTLLTSPESSSVYLLDEDQKLRAFVNEDVFWAHHYSFKNVALVSQDELDCYQVGSAITETDSISGVYADGEAWLVFGTEQAQDRSRVKVSSVDWQAVLKSWGVIASTYDDLLTQEEFGASFFDYPVTPGFALFRDGTLVSEVSSSTVYIVSGGIAMPIETWDAYLLMDFFTRDVIEVDSGTVSGVQGRVGNCSMDSFCVSAKDVFTCGGPHSEEGISNQENEEDEENDQLTDSGTSENDVPTGQGDTGEPETGEDTLFLTWSLAGHQLDVVTLSGEYTLQDGSSLGWQNLADAYATSVVDYERIGVRSGDSLRFSVEFEEFGGVSWSCLAPFPPGTVQGQAVATLGGTVLPVVAVADPVSNGCGLQVTIP